MLKNTRRIVSGAALATALALPTLALAHSKGEATMPADGAVLSAAPESIEMSFDMPMRITVIELTDAAGTAHDLVRTDDMQPVTAFIAHTATPLMAGQFTVAWRGLSADGHPMTGSFAFAIGE